MFTARTKIVKDRADQEPTELEDDVAKALFELQEQVSPPSLPSDAAVLCRHNSRGLGATLWCIPTCPRTVRRVFWCIPTCPRTVRRASAGASPRVSRVARRRCDFLRRRRR